MPYEPKTKEQAFQTWYELRNTERTLAVLRRDYPWAKKLSRPTLAKWIREDNWADRAARMDLIEKQFREESADVERVPGQGFVLGHESHGAVRHRLV